MKSILRRHPFLSLLAFIVLLVLGLVGWLVSAIQPLPEGANPPPRDTGTASAAHTNAIAASRGFVETLRRDVSYPSLSVAIARRNELLWQESIGWAAINDPVAATVDTQYPIGSVSKALTATAAMILVEQGVLTLDAPISTWLPDLPAEYGKVTMRQLLSHQAGVRHYRRAWIPPFFSENGLNKPFPTVEEGLSVFLDDPLLFQPDTSFNYSTFGYSLASRVMEAATKEDFSSLMARLLFVPLELEATGLNRKSPPPARLAESFLGFRGAGVMPAPASDSSYKWAGGGLASTPRDLVQFAGRTWAGGVLSAAALTEMTTPRKLPNGELNSQHYALGWRQGTMGIPKGAATTTPIIHHGGTALGSECMLMVAPEKEIVVAVCGNALTGGSGALLHLSADIARAFLDENKPASGPPASGPAEE